MKNIIIFIIVCLGMDLSLFGQNHFDHIKKDFLERDFVRKGRYDRIINHAFARIDYLQSSKANMIDYLESAEIQKIFQEVSACDQLTKAQVLIVAQLYELFFESTAKNFKVVLQQIVAAKNYWKKVFVQMEPLHIASHPSLWIHAHESKESVEKRIALFESLENQIAQILGMCLYGEYQLKKINDIADIDQGLQKIIQPFEQLINVEQEEELSHLFKKISALHDVTKFTKESAIKSLRNYGIPYHVTRYWYIYSALAMTTVAGVAAYFDQKEHLPEYRQKGQEAIKGFLQEFLVDPMKGLKRALWDRPNLDLKKFDLDNVPTSLLSCYTPERFGKYTSQTALYNLNKVIEVGEEIIKRQQVNYYLSAIVPVVAGMYGIYRQGRYYYNHESYFKPMRMIFREIDIVTNKMSGHDQETLFIDFGMMYYLLSQLDVYVRCLQAQERMMMEQDIQELLSFDLNVMQKQKVVERIYRTYKFLK